MEINKNSAKKPVEQNVNDLSRIAQGASVRGDLSSPTDIRVDGRLDGTLYSEGKVVAGESACLSGKMLCNNADFWGRMDGDIYVKDLYSIKNTAVVNGNLYVRRIQVEIGAQINGTIRMISEEEFDQVVAKLLKKDPVPPAAE
ncbi:MAG: polymer-forming cytoskeletal protein [Bacteroidales bacterium]|nr:polymer-forming cytoskeletal protein [Bacteroidales bacterium]